MKNEEVELEFEEGIYNSIILSESFTVIGFHRCIFIMFPRLPSSFI